MQVEGLSWPWTQDNLARAYEEAAAVATTADDVEDAAFESFLADRTPANEAAWQAATAIAEPLNAAKWSAFEAFRVEMQHGY